MSDVQIVYRFATLEDVPQLVGLLKDFSTQYSTKKPLFGGEPTVRIIESMVTEHLFIVAEASTELVGLIAGYNTSHPFNPDIKLLSESLWYVAPKWRKSSIGQKLIDEFIFRGTVMHADQISMCLHEASPVPETMLTDCGFKRTERVYLLEVS